MAFPAFPHCVFHSFPDRAVPRTCGADPPPNRHAAGRPVPERIDMTGDSEWWKTWKSPLSSAFLWRSLRRMLLNAKSFPYQRGSDLVLSGGRNKFPG